ncbi:MAG TPA: tetratricopeptide repeat protein, partial [Candidatus Polarisedimenticolia bacterium]|nr:tetratricopeptide repeat protein [Candidatus Polarisedimenticolia bacterium]
MQEVPKLSRCLGAWILALLPSVALASSASTPVPSDALLLLGLSHLHQGRFSQGQLQFRTYLESYPNDPRGPLFLAFCEWWRLLQVGAEPRTEAMESHLQEAIRLAQAGLAANPEEPEALTAMGTAYIFLAEYRASEHRVFKAAAAARKGKSYLDRASRLGPDQVDYQFGLGAYNYYADKVSLLVKGLRSMLFLPGGNSDLGRSQLEEVARRGRYFRTEANLLLAVIDQGRYERRYQSSFEHLQAALALNPESPVILGSVGELQIRLARYPESHRVLQRALAQCEGSSDREIEHLGRLLRILLADSLDLSLHSEAALTELKRAVRGAEFQSEWRNRAISV